MPKVKYEDFVETYSKKFKSAKHYPRIICGIKEVIL